MYLIDTMIGGLWVTLALISTVTAFLSDEEFHYPACAPPGTVVVSKTLPEGTTPPAIPQLGRKFQTILEGNMLLAQSTAMAKLYFDGYRNMAAIHQYFSGYETKDILDYTNNQLVSVKSDAQGQLTCETSDLRSSYFRGVFESKPSGKYPPNISNTVEALKMSKSNGLMYLGKTTVRGINAEHWLSCMYWEYLPLNFTIDLYFADESWSTPYSYRQIPLQFKTNGIDYAEYTDVYSYVNFKVLNETQEFDEPNPFQIPEDVVCNGNQTYHTKTMPSFSDNHTYVFEQEIVTEGAGKQTVVAQKIWLDSTHKLFRIDHSSGESLSPHCGGNTAREIWDLSAGSIYCIETQSDHCSVAALGKEYSVQKNGVQMMRNISELLFVNSSAQYRGQQSVRSIKSDVFVSNYTLVNPSSGADVNTVVTNFFSKASPGNVPLRVDVKHTYDGYKRQYNIYNFKAMEPQYLDFDITGCYDASLLQQVKIVFKDSKSPSELSQAKPDILTAIVDAVNKTTKLPYIRVQKADLISLDPLTFKCLIIGSPDETGKMDAKAMNLLKSAVTNGAFQIYVPKLQQTLTAASIG